MTSEWSPTNLPPSIAAVRGMNGNQQLRSAAQRGAGGALHLRITFGDVEGARRLIAAGADVHALNIFDASPLHRAASGAHVPIVEALLEAGAYVDAPNCRDSTPLHYALHEDSEASLEVLDLLIAAGANVDVQNSWGGSPLYLSIGAGTYDPLKAERLLAAGASLEIRDEGGRTPLLAAAQHGGPGVTSVLLQHGPDIAVCDHDGSWE